MAFTDWKLLDENYLKNLPHRRGYYILAIPDKFVFKLEQNYWVMTWKHPEINEILRRLKNNRVRITTSKGVTFTDIVMIGKTDDLKAEIEKHYSKSNKRIEALKKKVVMSFAYVLNENLDPGDENYLDDFKEKTEGIPPAGDTKSLPLKIPRKLFGNKVVK